MIEIRKTFSPDGMLRLDYLTGVAFSRESGAHRFVISGPEAFTGTVTASFMRADGQCVIVTGSLDEDGRAMVTADEDCYLVPGRMLITVYVTDGSVKTCVYAGLATVYDDRGSGEAPSGETTRTIEEMLEEILEGVDNAQQLLDDAGELLDDVTAEGATQVAAVQARGDQVIASIPSDYSTLTGDVSSLKSAVTHIVNQLQTTVSALSTLSTQKANIDGSYASLTAGTAEQLMSTVGVEDKVPYSYRMSGGGADVGDRMTEKVVGGTIAWNQLIQNNADFVSNASKTIHGVTYTFTAPNKITIQTDENGATETSIAHVTTNVPFVSGHKYLLGKIPSGANTSNSYYLNITAEGNANRFADEGYTIATLTLGSSSGNRVSISVKSGAVVTTPVTFELVLFDLTQMFGTAIADYVYSLEQATAGAGVAWFRKLFPNDYYAYNAGELMSVQAASHVTTGFNLLPAVPQYASNTSALNKTKAVRVIAGQAYEFNFSGIGNATSWRPIVRLWDLDGTLVVRESATKPDDNGDFTCDRVLSFNTASNVYLPGANGAIKSLVFTFLRDFWVLFSWGLGDTTSSMEMKDACFHAVYDGSRNGEYEPYVKHEYPLDSTLTLRGVPKLDTNNRLYYDGDTYTSDGTVTRRFGVVDLGTLTWSINGDISSYQDIRTSSITSAIKKPATNNDMPSIICKAFATVERANQGADKLNTIGVTTNGNLVCAIPANSYNDAAAFKTAMSGVMLVYELATPTNETADAYQNPQIVDDFGTEEYVDGGVTADPPTRDVSIPVGHETFYQANLRAKLESAPNSPDGNGDYIVRQTNGQNSYVPFSLPADELTTSYGLVKYSDIPTSFTFDQNILNGQYFSAGQYLLQATADIPAGNQIRPGVNCVKANVGDVLTSIINQLN